VPPAPAWPGGNRKRLLGTGVYIEPIKLLTVFSPEQFEIFVLQWIEGHLSKNYCEVQWRGGANDKGRDVIGWINDSSSSPRKCDIYQCKHYDAPLSPDEFWKELAKLCHYTFIKDYPVPNNYYIVTAKGVGNTLQDLIDAPLKLKQELIAKWDKKCEGKAGKGIPGPLTGALKQWVEDFDFSIIKTISPSRLINEHSNTRFHEFVFGIAIKERAPAVKPPKEIDSTKEVLYIKCLLEAYGDHTKSSTFKIEDFTLFPHLEKHFARTRVSFYSVETLKEFVRDNYTNNKHFDDLLEHFDSGIYHSYCRPCADGYVRLLDVCNSAVQLSVDSSVLKSQLSPDDRAGMCHHLANEGRITTWV